MGAADWIADAFFGPVIEERQRMDRDPGLPAYPWMPDGTPTPEIDGYSLPVSFVAAATGHYLRGRYPALINLDQLRRGVHLALAGTPDTRTPGQRRRDTWLAYQAAKERYEGRKAEAPQDGTGPAQEQATGPAEKGAAPGEEGPDRDGGPSAQPPADVLQHRDGPTA